MGLFFNNKGISMGEKENLKDFLIEAGMSKKEAEALIEKNPVAVEKAIRKGLLDELEYMLEEDMYL